MGIFQGVVNRFRSTLGYSTPFRSNEDKVYDTGCDWNPANRSTDGSIIGSKPYVEARIKDMIERDGFLSGALETHVIATVGSGLRLNSQPDWEELGQTEEWGEEFAEKIEKRWKRFTRGRKVDAGRKHNWAAFQAQAYRSFLIHGEILAIPKFKRGGDWGTSVMLIDPNRLATPMEEFKDEMIRAGIKEDEHGAPQYYYIHERNPLDSRAVKTGKSNAYKKVAAHSRTGRKKVIFIFDPVGTEQTRGISLFAAGIDSVKRQHDLSDAKLKAAIYQTLIAAVIKSELNWEQAMGIVGGSKGGAHSDNYLKGVQKYMEGHGDFYEQMGIKLDGLKTIHLLPNEDLELKGTSTVDAEYADFAKSMNREAARAANLPLEQYTGDWAELSYSGGQMSSGYTDRGHFGRRDRVMAAFNQDIYELFLEELFIREPELLPANVSFYEHREALSAARWMGPPPVLADPVKTAEAAEKRIENMITTREQEASAIGLDFDDLVKQLGREQEKIDRNQLRNPKLEETVLKQEAIKEKDIQGGNSNGK